MNGKNGPHAAQNAVEASTDAVVSSWFRINMEENHALPHRQASLATLSLVTVIANCPSGRTGVDAPKRAVEASNTA